MSNLIFPPPDPPNSGNDQQGPVQRSVGGWILRIGETDYLAETIEVLCSWASEGRVQPGHYIFHPLLQRWMYAREIDELRHSLAAKKVRPTKVRPVMGPGSRLALRLALGCLIIIVSLVVIIAVAVKIDSSGSQSSGSNSPQTPPPQEFVYSVAADGLFHDYEANEVAADAKYKGRLVSVSGSVQGIGKDILGNAYVVLGGRGLLDGVQCTFPRGAESSVASVSKGQQVTVKGRVTGKMGNVLVDDASFQ